jgi:magnesium transporter
MLSRSHTNYLAQLQIDNINQGNSANRMLSKVTLLASILVPLNLVCGMFGMNVEVPWKNVNNLGPFFGIFGFLIVWTVISVVVAKRMRYI